MTIFFHVSSKENTASIEKYGLNFELGNSAYSGIDYPCGNYLFTDFNAANTYACIRQEEDEEEFGILDAQEFCIWQVSFGGVVRTDPFEDDESGLGAYSVYITDAISADKMHLIS